MTYEVPYWDYKDQVDKYIKSFGHSIRMNLIEDENNILRIEDSDVLVSINNGVDKLIFKDKDHFLLWAIKWA